MTKEEIIKKASILPSKIEYPVALKIKEAAEKCQVNSTT